MQDVKKLSIHPRNWQGGSRKVVNTSKRANADRIKSVIASIEKHLDRHPNDGASKAHIKLLEGRL